MTRVWIYSLAACGVGVGLITSGCVSKQTARAQAAAAYMEGQRQATVTAQTSQLPLVSISGNVRYPTIPWTADLTLARALAAAKYDGVGDPSQIIVWRNGQSVTVDPRKLLQGDDMALEPGDRVDVRP